MCRVRYIRLDPDPIPCVFRDLASPRSDWSPSGGPQLDQIEVGVRIRDDVVIADIARRLSLPIAAGEWPHAWQIEGESVGLGHRRSPQ
jgi:hypothetical protein